MGQMCICCIKFMLKTLNENEFSDITEGSNCTTKFCNEKLFLAKKCPHLKQRRFKKDGEISANWSLITNNKSQKYSSKLNKTECRKCMHKNQENNSNYLLCKECGFYYSLENFEFGYVVNHVTLNSHECYFPLELFIRSQITIWLEINSQQNLICKWLFDKKYSRSETHFLPTEEGKKWFFSDKFSNELNKEINEINSFIENWSLKNQTNLSRFTIDTNFTMAIIEYTKSDTLEYFLEALESEVINIRGLTINQKTFLNTLFNPTYELVLFDFSYAEIESKKQVRKQDIQKIKKSIYEKILSYSIFCNIPSPIFKISNYLIPIVQNDIKTTKINEIDTCKDFNKDSDLKDFYIFMMCIYLNVNMIFTNDQFLLHLCNDRIPYWSENKEHFQQIINDFKNYFEEVNPIAYSIWVNKIEEFVKKIVKTKIKSVSTDNI